MLQSMLPNSIAISARVIFALCAFCLMALILILIRKNAIKEKYVLLWLPLGAGFFLASFFPDLLIFISARLKLHYITVVLLGIIAVYTGILLYFTTRLSQLREDVKRLAQEIALSRQRESQARDTILTNTKLEPDPNWSPIRHETKP
jgi:amino acid transporter